MEDGPRKHCGDEISCLSYYRTWYILAYHTLCCVTHCAKCGERDIGVSQSGKIGPENTVEMKFPVFLIIERGISFPITHYAVSHTVPNVVNVILV